MQATTDYTDHTDGVKKGISVAPDANRTWIDAFRHPAIGSWCPNVAQSPSGVVPVLITLGSAHQELSHCRLSLRERAFFREAKDDTYFCDFTIRRHVNTEAHVTPQRISFSAHPGTFWLRVFQCSRVDCSCTEVTFELSEMPDARWPSEHLAPVVIRVDVPTWQETNPPPRPPQLAAVVSEFLRDYSPAEREELQAWFGERQRILKRLNECRIDPRTIRESKLIGFRELIAPADDKKWDCPVGEHFVECGDAEYEVIEHYCPNPACPCREVYLSFLRYLPVPGDAERWKLEEQFSAKVRLDGRATVQEVFAESRSEAEAALAAWQQEYGDDREGLRWRYDKIKEIAGRSAPAASRQRDRLTRTADRIDSNDPVVSSQPDRLTRPAGRVGRNDPCPCGSGKKYKKCCGPAANRDSSPDFS